MKKIALILIFLNMSTALAAAPFNMLKGPSIKETNGSIRVMIIDDGIDAKNPIIRHFIAKNENLGTDNYKDSYGHGTAIAGTIIYGPLRYNDRRVTVYGNNVVCKQVKIYSCSYTGFNTNGIGTLQQTLNCYKEALRKKIDIINYSGGGTEFSESEYKYMLKLGERGIPVIAAAGNNRDNASVDPFYPASLSLKADIHNVYPVGSLNKNLKKSSFSNYGLPMIWEIGENVLSPVPPNSLIPAIKSVDYYHYKYDYLNGTSQATAVYTHKLLLRKCNEINKGE